MVASLLRKKKDAHNESLINDGIMIKCYNVIVAVKRIFLISGNKFSTYIDSQFFQHKLLGVNPTEFKVLWTATGL